MMVDRILAARILTAFMRKFDGEVRGEMTLPHDPQSRHVAVQTLHNILDRMDARIGRIRDGEETLDVPDEPSETMRFSRI